MRLKVLSLFCAGVAASVGSLAIAGDNVRGQSSWNSGAFDTSEDTGFSPIGSKGHFEEGTGPTSWYAPPDHAVTFKAGVLWLSRAHGVDEQNLVVELPPLSTPVLSTDDIDVDHQFKPGAIFTLGLNSDQVSGFDFTYWGLQDFNNSAVVTSNNFLGLAGTLQTATTDFIFANRFQVDYSSSINNAEANYRQTIEGVTLLAGFRYFGLEENFNINSRSAVLGTSSDYNIDAHNQMVGGQFGVGWGFDVWNFHFAIDTKFAIMANAASQETLLRDFDNVFTRRSYRAESMPTSLISDTGISGAYQITDWLALEVAYRFMWIENVALAPNQLDLTDSPPNTEIIDPRSNILLNGLSFGLQARW